LKEKTKWYSERLRRDVDVVRWGTHGTPVLLFPTAAGDAEECERFLMMDVLGPLMEEGRIKVYSVDSVAGEAMFSKDNSLEYATWVQDQFHAFVRHEVVPAIRADCRVGDIEIVTAGASIGAFHAVAVLCRYPDVFSQAIAMSGTYDLTKFTDGKMTGHFYDASPIHFLSGMPEGEHLERLRKRFVLLTHGDGRWEEPAQSWRMAKALGAKGIPNRVDAWGEDYDHDWPTWRAMLPKYLREHVPIQ
jgi:esterase/lipase superfamily enzyme